MAPAIVLIAVNAAFASGLGWALAKHLARKSNSSRTARSWFLKLLGVYLAECVAFSASMATNVLGFCLALVWGVVFGRRLTYQRRETARTAVLVSLYTCLPAVSFLSVLLLLALNGWSILTPEAGRRFGVPGFVPWPLCTLLGFFLAVSLSAVVVKTTLTTITALILSRRAGMLRDSPDARRL